MKVFDQLYIDGRWVAAHGTGTIDADHAATEEAIVRIPEGDAADVVLRWPQREPLSTGWAATAPSVRADALRRISAELARRVQTDGPVANWAAYAKVTEGFEFAKRVGSSLVIREPIGVVGCITP